MGEGSLSLALEKPDNINQIIYVCVCTYAYMKPSRMCMHTPTYRIQGCKQCIYVLHILINLHMITHIA